MKLFLKRYALPLVVGVNVSLLCILGALWVTPDGSLRGVSWHAPAPHLTDFDAQLVSLPAPAPADTSSFLALLEKPLFSPTRRPQPPAVSQDAQPAPVDNFSTAKLTGIFSSASVSGLIMRMAGKDVRVQVHQSLDGWTLTSLTDREATFVNRGQSRVLQLKRADLTQAPPGVPAPGIAASTGAKSLPFVPASASDSATHSERAVTAAPPPPPPTPKNDKGSAGAAARPLRPVFGGRRG